MTPIFTSFFTEGTEYEFEARQLEQSAHEFGLEIDVRGVPNLKDWCRNCAMKPAFIRDRMRDYPDRPVVWLDADARIRARPSLFDSLDCDFAAHWRNGVELLSGTTFWAPTYQARLLVEEWCERQTKRPSAWDQRTLQDIIGSIPDLRVERLPSTYTRVFDDPTMGEAVILHGQASRRLRAAV